MFQTTKPSFPGGNFRDVLSLSLNRLCVCMFMYFHNCVYNINNMDITEWCWVRNKLFNLASTICNTLSASVIECADEPLVSYILTEFPAVQCARELPCSRQPSPDTILNLLNPDSPLTKPTYARITHTIIQSLVYWCMFQCNSIIFRPSLRLREDGGVPHLF
jgi:hypothetical protein